MSPSTLLPLEVRKDEEKPAVESANMQALGDGGKSCPGRKMKTFFQKGVIKYVNYCEISKMRSFK